MKTKRRKIIISSLVLVAFYPHVQAQNLISNGGFEIYSSCPTALGEVYKATGWTDVIQNADYNNCSFNTNVYYPSPTGAYNGTGYIDFATYGDITGSAESIGEQLISPLIINHNYQFSVYAKKASGGNYSQVCGGVCLYGFITDPNLQTVISNCAGNLNTAVLLGCSDTVSDINWLPYSFQFTASDTFPYIVISPDCSPSCSEAMFIDDADLEDLTSGINILSNENNNVHILFNASSGFIEIKINETVYKKINHAALNIYDVTGKKIVSSEISSPATFIKCPSSLNGIYFFQLTDEKNIISKGRLYIFN